MPKDSSHACFVICLSCSEIILACGTNASAVAVGITLRGVLSKALVLILPRLAIPMLTADGTLRKFRAAAEKSLHQEQQEITQYFHY